MMGLSVIRRNCAKRIEGKRKEKREKRRKRERKRERERPSAR
jgi:hypothetical protein